jgi:tRNA(Ile)-lysidine synthase
MLLFANWVTARRCPKPSVLIVDHGLRDGSAKEAALARQWAVAQGFAAHVLRWRGAKPRANIEEKARAARYALMGEWCKAHAVETLLVAHTRDDLAETFLLRLGRGSGVDGLSAMRECAPLPVPGFAGIEVMRPLLGFSRVELREFLRDRGASWIEDPMNADPKFARVRVRALLPALEAAGVPLYRIASAATHLSRAREALDAATEDFLNLHARFEADGAALLDAAALKHIPPEIGLRVLVQVLMQVSGESYRPRFERLERLFDSVTSGALGSTLHGCRIGPAPKAKAVFGARTLCITREVRRKSAKSASAIQKAQRQEIEKREPPPG